MDDILRAVQDHGLSVVLVAVIVVIVMIPAGRRLAELIGAAVAFMEEALELVLALARGDGNGRASIWERMDRIEEQMRENQEEGRMRLVDLDDRLTHTVGAIEAHMATGARPECEARLRRIEDAVGEAVRHSG